MAIFAVEYVYDQHAGETMDRVRPEHRAYLGKLAQEGTVVASGPWVEGPPGALLLFRTEDTATLTALLEEDPFAKAGVITERIVRQWNPVIGQL